MVVTVCDRLKGNEPGPRRTGEEQNPVYNPREAESRASRLHCSKPRASLGQMGSWSPLQHSQRVTAE